MTDPNKPDGWLFDDSPEADRARRLATIVLALMLDRSRKGRRKLAGRHRAKLRRRKPTSKGS